MVRVDADSQETQEATIPARTKPMLGRDTTSRVWRDQLADYLRDLRVERGLTQDELGDIIGIKSKQMVSAWENGRATVPPERQQALADALKAPRKEFAKMLLRFTNPWAYADLFEADAELLRTLGRTAERVNVRKGPVTTQRARQLG